MRLFGGCVCAWVAKAANIHMAVWYLMKGELADKVVTPTSLQVFREAEPSSVLSEKVIWWCSPATTIRTAAFGSKPCTVPQASPTNPFHPPRTNRTAEGETP